MEGGGVIGRAERRCNQSDRFHRIAPAVVGHRVQCAFSYPLEMVGTASVTALLVAEGGQDVLDCFYPLGIEDACITGRFPVMVGKA